MALESTRATGRIAIGASATGDDEILSGRKLRLRWTFGRRVDDRLRKVF
jgi:hypothetical protein